MNCNTLYKCCIKSINQSITINQSIQYNRIEEVEVVVWGGYDEAEDEDVDSSQWDIVEELFFLFFGELALSCAEY